MALDKFGDSWEFDPDDGNGGSIAVAVRVVIVCRLAHKRCPGDVGHRKGRADCLPGNT